MYPTALRPLEPSKESSDTFCPSKHFLGSAAFWPPPPRCCNHLPSSRATSVLSTNSRPARSKVDLSGHKSTWDSPQDNTRSAERPQKGVSVCRQPGAIPFRGFVAVLWLKSRVTFLVQFCGKYEEKERSG